MSFFQDYLNSIVKRIGKPQKNRLNDLPIGPASVRNSVAAVDPTGANLTGGGNRALVPSRPPSQADLEAWYTEVARQNQERDAANAAMMGGLGIGYGGGGGGGGAPPFDPSAAMAQAGSPFDALISQLGTNKDTATSQLWQNQAQFDQRLKDLETARQGNTKDTDTRLQALKTEGQGQQQALLQQLQTDLAGQGVQAGAVNAQVAANGAVQNDAAQLQQALSARLAQTAATALQDRQASSALVTQGANNNLTNNYTSQLNAINLAKLKAVQDAAASAADSYYSAYGGKGGGGRGGSGGGSRSSKDYGYDTNTDADTSTDTQGNPFQAVWDAINETQPSTRITVKGIRPTLEIVNKDKIGKMADYLLRKTGGNVNRINATLADYKGPGANDLRRVFAQGLYYPRQVKSQTSSKQSAYDRYNSR